MCVCVHVCVWACVCQPMNIFYGIYYSKRFIQ